MCFTNIKPLFYFLDLVIVNGIYIQTTFLQAFIRLTLVACKNETKQKKKCIKVGLKVDAFANCHSGGNARYVCFIDLISNNRDGIYLIVNIYIYVFQLYKRFFSNIILSCQS